MSAPTSGEGTHLDRRYARAVPFRPLALTLALAAAALPLAAPAQDWAVLNPEPSEWSFAFQAVLGGGSFHDGSGTRSGVAPELDLLWIHRQLAFGPFLAAGGVEGENGENGQDGVWFGLAVGWSHRLEEHVRLDLLAEGGAHTAIVESAYAAEASGSATFPFVGVRAGLHLTGALNTNGALLAPRRAGVGLQVAARTDLGRNTVQPGSPPGAPATPPAAVGGQAYTFGVTIVLEW